MSGSSVRVFPLAVGDRLGAARFDDQRGSGTGRLAKEGSLDVSVTTLDALPLPRPPALLKIDIEGGEVAALQGASDTITLHRPAILVATHGPAEHAAVVDLLDRWDYATQVLVVGDRSRDTEILALPKASAAV